CRHTLVIHLLLRCTLLAFVPYLFPTHLNPHCDLINTFWPCQLLVFQSVTAIVVVSC
ncbi:unnamed protein product, partial [Hymenolepis diminuta]